MRLPDRTVAEFIRTPLTPMALMYLDTEASSSMHRSRRALAVLCAVFLLAFGIPLLDLVAEYQVVLGASLLAAVLPVAGLLAWVPRTANPPPRRDIDFLFAASGLVSGAFLGFGFVTWPLALYHLAVLSGFLMLATGLSRSVAQTAQTRSQLTRAAPERCAAAWRLAQKCPEIEALRCVLVAHGRQFLTVWEAEVITRHKMAQEAAARATQDRRQSEAFFAESGCSS